MNQSSSIHRPVRDSEARNGPNEEWTHFATVIVTDETHQEREDAAYTETEEERTHRANAAMAERNAKDRFYRRLKPKMGKKLQGKDRRDEDIMNTNNSSIVSKRSVERTYLPEPHFIRYFVKKPHRRSPLIHRGYWLRMHAIEQVVLKFLDEPSDKIKFILNLGCGHDTLPFQLLSKYPEKCQGAMFVDIDYPDLMAKKRDVIMRTPELQFVVQPYGEFRKDFDNIFLQSDHYTAVGCDLRNLRDLAELSVLLEEEFEISNCLVLCVAEVSITYMDVISANYLIKWAARWQDEGKKHPFAGKMLQHFQKFNTPLHSVEKYPLMTDQESRFLSAGYHSACARTLWDLWQDPSVVAPSTRLGLNKIEPFDEWEAFALFCSHYFVLEAVRTTDVQQSYIIPKADFTFQVSNTELGANFSRQCAVNQKTELTVSSLRDCGRHRTFGAMLASSNNTVCFHGGYGYEGRLQDTNGYWLTGFEPQGERIPGPPTSIAARLCHTITAFEDRKCLLVGGRKSPDTPLNGCWLRSGTNWRAVSNLPLPLYRHCATAVGYGREDAGVLVFGGRTTGGVASNKWLLWQEKNGWIELSPPLKELTPRFGASMATTGLRTGILLGGMTDEGIFCHEIWAWSISYARNFSPTLHLSLRKDIAFPPRMGASIIWTPGGLLLIGGVSTSIIPEEQEIMCLLKSPQADDKESCPLEYASVLPKFEDGGRPLLVGHSVFMKGQTLLLAGGGAVCFSFGSYRNQRTWTIKFPGQIKDQINYDYSQWVEHDCPAEMYAPRSKSKTGNSAALKSHESTPAEDIRRVRLDAADEFDHLIAKGRPFIMEGLDLGKCTWQWTLQEITTKIDPLADVSAPSENQTHIPADVVKVVVHEAEGHNMNFLRKNFRYVKKSFRDFIKSCEDGSPQYLRSLARNKPTDKPAHFHEDFPTLKDDFQVPPQLGMVMQNEHSSPLRISGPVNMWLHYDIVGEKVVALYPPSDAVHFQIPPGSSSSPIDIFSNDPEGRGQIAHPRQHMRAHLQAGEVLYVPPLWLHSVSPLANFSISVNVFFRNLKGGYAAGRDVYGNRDLQAYENGRKNISRMIDAFKGVPDHMAKAYLERLAKELKEAAKMMDDSDSTGDSDSLIESGML
ncbi:MAG: hypothetical protein Q9174_003437 [Haloplaca sp. 1 TL-2023]